MTWHKLVGFLYNVGSIWEQVTWSFSSTNLWLLIIYHRTLATPFLFLKLAFLHFYFLHAFPSSLSPLFLLSLVSMISLSYRLCLFPLVSISSIMLQGWHSFPSSSLLWYYSPFACNFSNGWWRDLCCYCRTIGDYYKEKKGVLNIVQVVHFLEKNGRLSNFD